MIISSSASSLESTFINGYTFNISFYNVSIESRKELNEDESKNEHQISSVVQSNENLEKKSLESNNKTKSFVEPFGSYSNNLPSKRSKVETEDVIPILSKLLMSKMREHQIYAANWIISCLYRNVNEKENGITGCILADEMGLGKSLTSLAVIWSCIRSGSRKGSFIVLKIISYE